MKRIRAAAVLWVGLWSVSRPADADPVALRHPGPQEGAVFQAGWPQVGAAWWLRPGVGLALDWRLPASAVAGAVGTRRRAELGDGPWVVDAYLAGGLVVPTLDPGLALSATPAFQLGWRAGRGEVDVGLALPLELGLLSRRQLRAPVLLEAGLGADAGPAEIGLRGGFGPVLTAPGALGFAVQWSLWVRVPRAGDP